MGVFRDPERKDEKGSKSSPLLVPSAYRGQARPGSPAARGVAAGLQHLGGARGSADLRPPRAEGTAASSSAPPGGVLGRSVMSVRGQRPRVARPHCEPLGCSGGEGEGKGSRHWSGASPGRGARAAGAGDLLAASGSGVLGSDARSCRVFRLPLGSVYPWQRV